MTRSSPTLSDEFESDDSGMDSVRMRIPMRYASLSCCVVSRLTVSPRNFLCLHTVQSRDPRRAKITNSASYDKTCLRYAPATKGKYISYYYANILAMDTKEV